LSKLDARVRETSDDLNRAKSAQQKLSLLDADIERLTEQGTALKTKLDEAEQMVQRAIVQQERAVAIVSEREAALPDSLRDRHALARAQQQAADRVRALKEAFEKAEQQANATSEAEAKCRAALEAAENTARAAERQGEAQREKFAAGLREAGFESETEFHAAKRSNAEIKQLDEEIRRFEGDLQAARQRVERAQQEAENLTAPDIKALEHAADTAKRHLEQVVQEKAALVERRRQIDTWLDDLSQGRSQLESLQTRYDVVGAISEVANGKNRHGITFQRFVLSALLDDVLLVASKRLQMMSRGRFQLQRARERADQRTAGGLDLETFDTYTGTTRPISNLSGGESFLASLALALGLADVVQSYSGGIHLETIFIDEGFGSLDPEALDLALRTLIDLQQGGRLVGIISHVPELKERIDARLEVSTDKLGRSTARFVV
jgi:exonuclease SbcC